MCFQGRRADIFALGLIYYFVFSDGRHAFGTTRAEIRENVLSPDFYPELPLALQYIGFQDVIRIMLAHNYRDRPTADIVLATILQMLPDEQ